MMTIHNANCVDLIASLPRDSIDMVLTSPPYDDMKSQWKCSERVKDWKLEWHLAWRETIAGLSRVVKPGGVVVWVTGDATKNGSESGTSFQQAMYAMECGFKLHDTMIYHKRNPMPCTGLRYMQAFEYMFVFSRGIPKTFNPIMLPCVCTGKARIRNRNGYRTIQRTTLKKASNVFSYKIGGNLSASDDIAFKHPAVFPEQLAEDQIKTWSNEGDIIFDPFMGSGTTGKMALLNKRSFIGCDISKEYCDIAQQRMASLGCL